MGDKKKRFKKEPKIGISFKSSTSAPGKVFVSNIKEESKFFETDLTVGHQVLAINGQPCPPRVNEAVELLTKKGVDKITLVTIDPEDEIVVPKAKEEPIHEVLEEKKEDCPEEVPSEPEQDEKGEEEKGEEEAEEAEKDKSLLDTMFGVCMC